MARGGHGSSRQSCCWHIAAKYFPFEIKFATVVHGNKQKVAFSIFGYIAGVTLTRKNCVFYVKKSRLRKSENAVRLLYAKNSDLIHQNAFSLFVFCTQQRRFVEHLPWV